MPVSQRLSFAEDITIYHALEQKAHLLDALATSDELELDLLQVGEIETAAILRRKDPRRFHLRHGQGRRQVRDHPQYQ